MQSTNYHIILGAINLSTGLYTLPNEANKDTIYQCIGCKEDVFLKQGRIRSHHFCHYPTSQCTYYIHSSESEIHKNAKLRIKSLLEQKCEVSLLRECTACQNCEQYDLPILSNTSVIELEYRFNIYTCHLIYTEECDNKSNETIECIADVAYMNNEEPLCMIEIYHTHLTSKERRSEPWFEINAIEVLQTEMNDNKIQLHCIRKEQCDNCIEQYQEARYITLCSNNIRTMTDSDLDFYIRYHLGQRTFKYEDQYDKNKNTYIRSIPGLGRNHPNKLSWHEDDENNDRIINMFSNKFKNFRVVVRGYKGGIYMKILSKDDIKIYTPHDLQDISKYYSSGYRSTYVKIIMDIVQLTNKYDEPILRKVYNESDDDADTYRHMRYEKQYYNACKVTTVCRLFDVKLIKYTIHNHIFVIIHPLTNKIIRFTPKSNKVLCNSKWINKIYSNDIILWYKASVETSTGFEHMWSLK